jgi:hypothetical protein
VRHSSRHARRVRQQARESVVRALLEHEAMTIQQLADETLQSVDDISVVVLRGCMRRVGERDRTGA